MGFMVDTQKEGGEHQWSCIRNLVRRKQVDSSNDKADSHHHQQLAKALTFPHLIAVGVGSTIGAGVYILVGTVAREHSGPALAFSFLIAGVSAALSAFCYAELSSRFPSAGSAYHYSYICIGEGVAWLIGWALILEYTIGGSTVARGISPNLAMIFGGEDCLPAILARHQIPGLDIVVDPCAAVLVFIVTGLLCIGVKESTFAQGIITTVNVFVMIFVIVAGSYLCFKTGWPGYQLPSGYFPYGVDGMLAGSATVFFAYIGFDSVASMAEEVKNPQRDLPLGIGLSLLLCCLLYMMVSVVIVGLVPYYAMDPDTPISSAFATHGIQWAAYLITLGAVMALCWVVRDYYRLVQSVNAIELQIQSLSDEQLKAKTSEFRERLARGESLADMQAEAFSVVREAAKRTIGMRHFDVQIIGGGVLHDGSIAEMKTGEGKTLVSTLAAYLNALTGEGVHVVTVNDYLAQRDAEWMGRVHRFLGLSVGLIQRGMKAEERKFNYGCDITYTNNSELGFDYLRDNLTSNSEQLVMRWPKPFHFAIVDEVDSVLIDEGRNPLLISGEANENAARYPVAAKVAELLVKDSHYKVELKENSVELTEEGISLAEMALETGDLWDENDPWARFVMNALKAKEFYKRDVQYIVRNGKALIINELTGRVEEKRRWSEGVHQAVEAKEGLEIQADSIVVAQITYQSLFKLYPKLSGMTGTAKTEEKEFLKMFQIPVIEVPTNLSNIRIDLPIQAFATARGKYEYVRREVEDMFGQGRPVLVGTTSVENSEYLSALLKEWGIPHNVLNARPKYAAREADFIAQAGRKYAITISTNMAGRGTDIILGGNPKMLAREIIEDSILTYLTSEVLADDIDDNELSQKVLSKIKVGPSSLALLARASLMAKYVGKSESKSWTRKKAKSVVTESLEKSQTMDPMELQNLVNEQSEMYPLGPAIALAYLSVLKDCEAHCLYEGSEVKRLGGLHVIGTSLHESRRIDNQLRGRAGRQGDPGSTRFMVSLQDEMFQKFNFDTEWAVRLISKITNDEDLPIEGDTIVKQLLALQINAEKYFFGIRKSLVEFDEVLEVQRKHVYDLRQLLLTGDNESCSQHIYQYMQAVVDEIVVGNSDPNKHPRNWNLTKLLKEFMAISGNLLDESFSGITEATMLQSLENLHETSSIDMDNFHLPYLPKPPNAFRGIRRKNSSLRRWLDICSDDLTGSGRYRTSINLLRKFLGDYLIASYLSVVQESGFDDGYVKEIERAVLLKTLDCFWRDHLVNMNKLSSAVNVRSFAHRNPLEEYKIDGCRFFISMLSATRRLTIESILQYWSSPMESQELFVS